MSASIHPPVFTDAVANPLLHSMGQFFESQGVTHADINNVLNTWLVMIILVVAAVLVKNKLEMIPRGGQNFWEVIVSTLEDIVVQTMGEHGRPYFPLIASLALFILTCNLIGIIPWFQSSTNNLNTTLALALVAFLYDSLCWDQRARHPLHQTFSWTRTLADSTDASYRTDRTFQPDPLSELPTFWKHNG